nr:unnamed protein product [Spirometra erinaceieuropaei]
MGMADATAVGVEAVEEEEDDSDGWEGRSTLVDGVGGEGKVDGDDGRIFDEYVPPEGDGKTSLLSTEGLTEKKDLLSKKAKSMRAMRRISKHQPTFSTAAFPSEADAIYKEANLLLPRYVLKDILYSRC